MKTHKACGIENCFLYPSFIFNPLSADVTDRQTDIHTYRQADIQTNKQTDIHTDKLADRKADIQTDTQADRQTYIHTDGHNKGVLELLFLIN